MKTQPEPTPPGENVPTRLADFLAERRDFITRRWIETVRRNDTLEAAKRVNDEQLADHLPRLFNDLSAILRGDPADGAAERDAEAHGEHRWQQHYSLEEVLKELGIVSRMVLKHGLDAFEEVHLEIPRKEINQTRGQILQFFANAEAGSSRQYAKKQREQLDALHLQLREADRTAATAIQTERDRLADVFKRSPSFIALVTGPEHVFELVNDRYYQLVGHRDLLRRPVREALPELAGQPFFDWLDGVYTTGEPFVGNDVRIMLQRAPGEPLEEHYLDFIFLPTRAVDGTITGLFIHGVDWTERKTAEQTLAQMSEQRRLALDSAQMGWWHLDLIEHRVYWDERFRAIFGVSGEELSYEKALSIIHPEDRAGVDAAVKASTRPVDPVPHFVEYRVVHADGAVHWVQSRGKARFEGEGEARRAVSMVGTILDITDAKAAQDALAESEAKYRALFDSVDSAFCVLEMIWDAQGKPIDYRFVEVNSNFVQHNGFHEPAGKTALELVPNLETRWFEVFGEVARTGKPNRFVEGSEAMGRWFDLYAFPLGTGERRRVAVLFNDITQRLKSEQALRAAKAEAEAASRAKDDFLAALSHELRTPLTPVLMAADDLSEDPALPASIRETLRMMQRNIALEARLIDDLLDLTRIANGKLELRAQDCEAHSLVGLAVEIVRDDAQAKGLALEVDFAAMQTHFRGDPARVQQVFWNLLKNAVKFTPAGGRIVIRSRDEGEHLVIEVVDTGAGLAPEFLERIFNPFEQAGLVNNARFGGLGLGLAIAKAIVELHGGTIRAESAGLGQGATFRVELAAVVRPMGITGNDDQSDATVTPKPPAQSADASGTQRLLLVEDHEATLTVLTRLLTRAGYTVTTASSVADARSVAEHVHFDLVISDIGLPDGTGIELMEVLHRKHGLRGIALTGYGMEDDLRRSREVGFVEHLVKPVDFAQLRRAIVRLAATASGV